MNKKGFWGMFSVIFMIVIFIVYIITIFTGIHYKTTINGVHTGQITAIETNGLIFKTTTVYFKSDAQSSQEDRYCLIDKSLIPLLDQYSKDKAKVTIYYISYVQASITECGLEEDAIIIGVDQ